MVENVIFNLFKLRISVRKETWGSFLYILVGGFEISLGHAVAWKLAHLILENLPELEEDLKEQVNKMDLAQDEPKEKDPSKWN